MIFSKDLGSGTLPLQIARRYLFSKKTTNVINIITGISAVGIAVGTAALILVLCVFNGFEDLVSSMMGKFNPDVKITTSQGKTFKIDSTQIAALKKIEGVKKVSISLEEVAFFQYGESQDFGVIKGVDADYQEVTSLDSALQEGRYMLERGNGFYGVVGGGVRNKLGINIDNPLQPLNIYMAKREDAGALEQQFNSAQLMPIGTFSIQQDFDNQYVITSLALTQSLLQQPNQASAIEIKLDKINNQKAISEVRNLLGNSFVVKDKYQQNEAFLKILNIEKWMSFVILCLTMVLVAFNLVGALWMIAMDRKKDIAILKSIGMDDQQVKKTFLSVGFWLLGVGMLAGFIIAIVTYFIHKMVGIIPIPEGFMVDTYPAQLRYTDFIVVAVAVLLIGIIAAFPAANRAMKTPINNIG